MNAFRIRTVLAAAGMLLATAGLAQYEAPPSLSEGESWTFAFENKHDRSQKYTYTWTVRTVAPTHYGVEFQNDQGRRSPVGLSRNLNMLRRAGSGPFEENKWFAWPMKPGDSWKYAFDMPGGSGKVRYEMEAKVEGPEEVTVPAGKFTTMRIVTSGRYVRDSDARSGQVHETVWYAPEAKTAVKRLFRQTDVQGALYDDSTVELTARSLK